MSVGEGDGSYPGLYDRRARVAGFGFPESFLDRQGERHDIHIVRGPTFFAR